MLRILVREEFGSAGDRNPKIQMTWTADERVSDHAQTWGKSQLSVVPFARIVKNDIGAFMGGGTLSRAFRMQFCSQSLSMIIKDLASYIPAQVQFPASP
jgi:hypothetical protein